MIKKFDDYQISLVELFFVKSMIFSRIFSETKKYFFFNIYYIFNEMFVIALKHFWT